MRLRPSLTWILGLLCFGTPSLPSDGAPAGGRFVLSQRSVVVASIPILPDLSTETWSVSLVDLKATPDRLRGSGKLCHIEMQSSSSLVRTRLPPAFVRLLYEVQVDARISEGPGGFAFWQAPRTVVLGASLRDPENEALPRDPEDPRVVDQDGDGHPGVTVEVRGIVSGEVYVVQRGSASLRGESDAFGFHGQVRFQTEDVVLGASKPVLTRRTRTQPDLARSTFVLRRVGDQDDCDAAVRMARRAHPGP